MFVISRMFLRKINNYLDFSVKNYIHSNLNPLQASLYQYLKFNIDLPFNLIQIDLVLVLIQINMLDG